MKESCTMSRRRGGGKTDKKKSENWKKKMFKIQQSSHETFPEKMNQFVRKGFFFFEELDGSQNQASRKKPKWMRGREEKETNKIWGKNKRSQKIRLVC